MAKPETEAVGVRGVIPSFSKELILSVGADEFDTHSPGSDMYFNASYINKRIYVAHLLPIIECRAGVGEIHRSRIRNRHNCINAIYFHCGGLDRVPASH